MRAVARKNPLISLHVAIARMEAHVLRAWKTGMFQHDELSTLARMTLWMRKGTVGLWAWLRGQDGR